MDPAALSALRQVLLRGPKGARKALLALVKRDSQLSEDQIAAMTRSVILDCVPEDLAQVILAANSFEASRRGVIEAANEIVARLTELAAMFSSLPVDLSNQLLMAVNHLGFPERDAQGRVIDVSPLVAALAGAFESESVPEEVRRGSVLALFRLNPKPSMVDVNPPIASLRAALLIQAQTSVASTPEELGELLPRIVQALDSNLPLESSTVVLLARMQAMRVWTSRAKPQMRVLEQVLDAAMNRLVPLLRVPLLHSIALESFENLVGNQPERVFPAELLQKLAHDVVTGASINGPLAALTVLLKRMGPSRVLEAVPDFVAIALRAVLDQGSSVNVCKIIDELPDHRSECLAAVAVSLASPDDQLASRTNQRIVLELLSHRSSQQSDARAMLLHPSVGKSLWAQLCILLALERSGCHIACSSLVVQSQGLDVANWRVGTKYLTRALSHGDERIRGVAWALATTRAQSSVLPEADTLACIREALPFVAKTHEGAAKDRLRESLNRLMPRVLDGATLASSDAANVDAVSCRDFAHWLAGYCSRGVYRDGPVARIEFCLNTLKLLLPFGIADAHVESLLGVLAHSSFDTMRTTAFDLLCNHVEAAQLARSSLMEKVAAQPWSAIMRRDADAGALLLRLVYTKLVSELGWAVDLLGSSAPGRRSSMVYARALDCVRMRQARNEACKCVTVPTAYDVGCVLCDAQGNVLSTGFSRELEANTHAEECALAKLSPEQRDLLHTCYTTMEPCSVRLSGSRSCTSRLLEARVARVVIGVPEPPDFVVCEGIAQLRAAGVFVDILDDEAVVFECADLSVPVDLESSLIYEKQLQGTNWPMQDAQRHFVDQVIGLVQTSVKTMQPLPNTVLASRGLQSAGLIRGDSVHGALMALRYLVAGHHLDQHPDFQAMLSVLLEAAKAACQTAMHASEVTDCRGWIVTDDDADSTLPTTQSWLTLREGGELLGEICMSGRLLLSVQELTGVALWFMDSLLELRHLGAVAHIARGLERAAKALWSCNRPELVGVPSTMAQSLLDKLELEGFDKSLRRSEGFSLALRSLSRVSLQLSLVILKSVLEVAQRGKTEKSSIHALNVLRALYLDSELDKQCTDAAGMALALAVRGFESPAWGVRNASLSLFSAVCARAVGMADNSWRPGKRAPVGSCIPSTAGVFFSMYPSALEVVKTQLSHSCPHPTLVLLAMLSRDENERGPAFAHLFEGVVALLAHKEYMVRSASARALVSCVPTSQAVQVASRLTAVLLPLSGSAREEAVLPRNENAAHGALMALTELVEAGLELPAQMVSAVVASQRVGSLVTRAEAVRLLAACRRPVAMPEVLSSLVAEADGSAVGRTSYLVAVAKALAGPFADSGEWIVLMELCQLPAVRLAVLETLAPVQSHLAPLWRTQHVCLDNALLMDALLDLVARVQHRVPAYWGGFALGAYSSLSVSGKNKALVVIANAAGMPPIEYLRSHASSQASLLSRAAAAESLQWLYHSRHRHYAGESDSEDLDAEAGLAARQVLLALLQDEDDVVREVARRAVPGELSLRACLDWVVSEACSTFATEGKLVDWLLTMLQPASLTAAQGEVAEEEGQQPASALYTPEEASGYAEGTLLADLASQSLARCRRARLALASDDKVESEVEFWHQLAVKAVCELQDALDQRTSGAPGSLAVLERRLQALLLCRAVGDSLDPTVHVLARRAAKQWDEPLLVQAVASLRQYLEGGVVEFEALL